MPAISLDVAVLDAERLRGFTGFIPLDIGGGTGVAVIGLGGVDDAEGAGAVEFIEEESLISILV